MALSAKGTVSEEKLEDIAAVFSVVIKDLPRSINRFTNDVRKQQQLLGYTKKKIDSFFSKLSKIAGTNLQKACSELFETWKVQRRALKKK